VGAFAPFAAAFPGMSIRQVLAEVQDLPVLNLLAPFVQSPVAPRLLAECEVVQDRLLLPLVEKVLCQARAGAGNGEPYGILRVELSCIQATSWLLGVGLKL
jgi:hypothetical protein